MSARRLLTPSFRNRLRLFFVGVVVLPIVAVASVIYVLTSTSERSQTDAQLGAMQYTAQTILDRGRERADRAAETMGRDQALANAIASGDPGRIRERVQQLADESGARYVLLRLNEVGRFEVGRLPAMAGSLTRLRNAQDRPVGDITASLTSPQEYATEANRLANAEVVVEQEGERLASTMPAAVGRELPDKGAVDIGGREYRTKAFSAASATGNYEVRLIVLDGQAGISSGRRNSGFAVAALLGFIALAFTAAIAVSRRLQSEVQRFLDAAQRLGAGDFSVRVPEEGDDEFAALGREFNSMAGRLERQLEELRRERARLQEAIRRVGESFAKGLDRDGLLRIVVQTAVDGIGGSVGRASMRGRTGEALREVARAGDPGPFSRALHAAEAAVLDAGQLAEIQLGGSSALAAPLGTTETGNHVIGVVSVARGDRAFTPEERELFAYLTSQASVSVENVDLHETVQRQAVTDELTGLFNHRRFQEVMGIEVERARRYGHEMALIMLDIDNFKRVNDRYGHLQGDEVLRAVARVLRQSSREIDEPARYGGEEMAIALPQTDLEGAYQFAERVRRRIEKLELRPLDADEPLRVTASFGVASLGTAGVADKDGLVAAADAALYEAKRSGKNRTVRASARTESARDVHGVVPGE